MVGYFVEICKEKGLKVSANKTKVVVSASHGGQYVGNGTKCAETDWEKEGDKKQFQNCCGRMKDLCKEERGIHPVAQGGSL